jgi:hypothetical protein
MAIIEFGIEFEYLFVDRGGRMLDFGDLEYETMAALIADRPGLDDAELAKGDLGIKAGYWYLEGDERFGEDGRFRTLEIKGIEIRTPPLPGVGPAVGRLLELERQLSDHLRGHDLGLGICGFNPVRAEYRCDPPLNAWERALRAGHRAYDGSQVSTLSYGPDINLSFSGWTAEQNLDAVRKLNAYAPCIVPFSFSSPFHRGSLWHGLSKRTYERAGLRPAVKLFAAPDECARYADTSALIHPARLAREVGRIEFKAFDAFLDVDVLTACCHLLAGICLATGLPGRSEVSDVARYRRAALKGFADDAIRNGAQQVLAAAAKALDPASSARLAPLFEMIEAGRTPVHGLLAAYRSGGPMFKPGGLAATGEGHG